MKKKTRNYTFTKTVAQNIILQDKKNEHTLAHDEFDEKEEEEKKTEQNRVYVGLITAPFSMNKRIIATANRLADTYGIYYMFNLVKCEQ